MMSADPVRRNGTAGSFCPFRQPLARPWAGHVSATSMMNRVEIMQAMVGRQLRKSNGINEKQSCGDDPRQGETRGLHRVETALF